MKRDAVGVVVVARETALGLARELNGRIWRLRDCQDEHSGLESLPRSSSSKSTT